LERKPLGQQGFNVGMALLTLGRAVIEDVTALAAGLAAVATFHRTIPNQVFALVVQATGQ
jgi:hypothetical protein